MITNALSRKGKREMGKGAGPLTPYPDPSKTLNPQFIFPFSLILILIIT